MRQRVPSVDEVAQAVVSPTASAVGASVGSRTRVRGRAVRSCSAIATPSLRRIQTPAPPVATAIAPASRFVAVIAFVCGSIRTIAPEAVMAQIALPVAAILC